MLIVIRITEHADYQLSSNIVAKLKHRKLKHEVKELVKSLLVHSQWGLITFVGRIGINGNEKGSNGSNTCSNTLHCIRKFRKSTSK